jgi:hypothetical protein
MCLLFCSVRKSIQLPVEEVPEKPSKRSKKIESSPNTSIESSLRQESLKSLLTLIRTENDPSGQPADAAANTKGIDHGGLPHDTQQNGVQKQAVPVISQICEICMHRRARVSITDVLSNRLLTYRSAMVLGQNVGLALVKIGHAGTANQMNHQEHHLRQVDL